MASLECETPIGNQIARTQSGRITQRPSSYAEDQELEAVQSRAKKSRKRTAAPIDNPTEPETIASSSNDLTQLILKKITCQTIEIQKLHLQLIERDKTHKQQLEENEKRYQLKVAKHQEEVTKQKDEIKNLHSQVAQVTKALETLQIDELRKTVDKIHATISQPPAPVTQSPSTGRSWASVVTASSVITPTTKSTTNSLALPSIVINLRNTPEELKQTLGSTTTAKACLIKAIGVHNSTKQVIIEGVKIIPGIAVRVFLGSDQDVKSLRENKHWLQRLEGASLKGDPWFPIKIDDVRKMDIFNQEGKLRIDFNEVFEEENQAHVKRIQWLSGSKPYGSMALFLGKESDVSRMLHRKMVQIRGEVSFTSEYRYRERPTRCRNCQGYGHKEIRCKNATVCEKCAGIH